MINFQELENFKRLNGVQREAVLHDNGPLLVLWPERISDFFI